MSRHQDELQPPHRSERDIEDAQIASRSGRRAASPGRSNSPPVQGRNDGSSSFRRPTSVVSISGLSEASNARRSRMEDRDDPFRHPIYHTG